MGGTPVTRISSGGRPVRDVDGAIPVTNVTASGANGGIPVTLVPPDTTEGDAKPVTFVNDDLSRDLQLPVHARWDVSDLSKLWQNVGGTTPVTTIGEDVFRVDDLDGYGVPLLGPTGGSEKIGTYQTDGTKHWIDIIDSGATIGVLPGDASDVDVYFAIETADTLVVLMSAGGWVGESDPRVGRIYNVGTLETCIPSKTRGVEVDDTSLSPDTNAQLYTELNTGTGHALSFRGLDLDGEDLVVGGYHGIWKYTGKLHAMQITNELDATQQSWLNAANLAKTT